MHCRICVSDLADIQVKAEGSFGCFFSAFFRFFQEIYLPIKTSQISFFCKFPVYYLKPVIYIISPFIIMLQIIGVFPHINI